VKVIEWSQRWRRMRTLVFAGKVVNFAADEVTRTIADGCARRALVQSIEHIRKFVDDIVTVSEDEIREAMRVWRAIRRPWPT
jgi:threonine dehydratase